jgi:hypothetical protein
MHTHLYATGISFSGGSLPTRIQPFHVRRSSAPTLVPDSILLSFFWFSVELLPMHTHLYATGISFSGGSLPTRIQPFHVRRSSAPTLVPDSTFLSFYFIFSQIISNATISCPHSPLDGTPPEFPDHFQRVQPFSVCRQYFFTHWFYFMPPEFPFPVDYFQRVGNNPTISHPLSFYYYCFDRLILFYFFGWIVSNALEMIHRNFLFQWIISDPLKIIQPFSVRRHPLMPLEFPFPVDYFQRVGNNPTIPCPPSPLCPSSPTWKNSTRLPRPPLPRKLGGAPKRRLGRAR